MTIEIRGLNEAIQKLDKLGKLKFAITALRAGAIHIKGKVMTYPPDTIANSPDNPTGKWYERNWGSKWIRKRDGSIGGRKTSESLKHRWGIKEVSGGLTQIIGNNASYAPFVHDPDEQSAAMKRIGWKTTKQVADEEADKITQFITKEIENALRE